MPTSISNTEPKPITGVIGADDEVGYRTISVLAIVSLTLGLSAPLCLIAPLLVAIPLAGGVVALLAISRIAASEGALIGRTAALVGLALCVASIAAAATRATLRDELLSRQARRAALEWVALLQQGDAARAYELTVASRQPPPAPPPGSPPDATAEPARPPLDVFREQPVVHFLLEHAQNAAVRYVQDEAIALGTRGDATVRQQYVVESSLDPASSPTTALALTMQRTRTDGTNPSQWLVSAFESDALASQLPEHDRAHTHPH